MKNNTENLKYNRAKERVTDLKMFYIMLVGSCLLIPFLIFLNHQTNPEIQWFWFPVFGIGISLLYYSIQLFAGRKWEERKTRELMEKDQFKN